MKRVLLVTALTAIGVLTAFGQLQSKSSGSSNSSSSTSVKKGDRELISSGTVVNAELMNSIDVRKSKVGDQVLFRTTKAIKQAGDTVVAKGTTLVGRITEIQQRTKENSESRVGMLIERIQGKELDAPISVSILSMTAAQATASTSDAFADAGLISNSSATGQRGQSGGGLLGGVGSTVGGVVNTATQTTGSVVSGATQTVGNTVGGITQTTGNTVGTVGQTVNGIQISQAMGGSASGSTNFSAQKKDVRIEKGATFNVQFNNSVSN